MAETAKASCLFYHAESCGFDPHDRQCAAIAKSVSFLPQSAKVTLDVNSIDVNPKNMYFYNLDNYPRNDPYSALE